MSSEIEIKAMVLERLLCEGRFSDSSALVFNEMSLAGKSRRLDLGYVQDRKMVAIEIKSEKDSLLRLSGQLDEYRKYFDRVVVVAASKFVDGVVQIAGSDVEVWAVSQGEVEIVRRGRLIKGVSKVSYLDLMTKREISILAKMVGIRVGDTAMYELKAAVANSLKRVSAERVKDVLLEGFRNRFGLASNRFLRKALEAGGVNSSDIHLLSPYRQGH